MVEHGSGSPAHDGTALLTARKVAELLGFAPGTIVDWAEAGRVPAFKIGGRLRFRLSEVEAWLETKRAGAGGEVAPVPFRAPTQGRSLPVAPVPSTGGEEDNA
jgi:excisionase family DNA binding protein